MMQRDDGWFVRCRAGLIVNPEGLSLQNRLDPALEHGIAANYTDVMVFYYVVQERSVVDIQSVPLKASRKRPRLS